MGSGSTRMGRAGRRLPALAAAAIALTPLVGSALPAGGSPGAAQATAGTVEPGGEGGLVPVGADELARIEGEVPQRAEQARQALLAGRAGLGLSADDDLTEVRRFTDEFGRTHVRFAQTYRGIPVIDAQAIAHVGAGGEMLETTNALRAGITGDVKPSVTATRAKEIAAQAGRAQAEAAPDPSGADAALALLPVTERVRVEGAQNKPEDELNAVDLVERVKEYALVWQVTLRYGDEQAAGLTVLVDARSGAVRDVRSVIVEECSGVCTSATGTGESFHSGEVDVSTTREAGLPPTYWMEDRTREIGGDPLVIASMVTEDDYDDSDNAWGDGTNLDSFLEDPSADTMSESGQTAAVDVMHGLAGSYDMYENVFGWDPATMPFGIERAYAHACIWALILPGCVDGLTTTTSNAYYSPTSRILGFGDGDGGYNPLTEPDVVGHELGHAVSDWYGWWSDAGGEHAGLQEGVSDALGTLTEWYLRGGGIGTGGSTIPDSNGFTIVGPGGGTYTVTNGDADWVMGSRVVDGGIRNMYNPSALGDAHYWSSDVEDLEAHEAATPFDRAFYFLAQGATFEGNTSAEAFLENGTTGVGNTKAGKIAWRAATVYFTTSTDYADARDAFLDAAQDLYGTGDEYAAVENAFAGIDVGSTAGGDSWASVEISESESNNSRTTSDYVPAYADTLDGTASSTTDYDYYQVSLAPGQSLRLYAQSCRSTTLTYSASRLTANLYDRSTGASKSWASSSNTATTDTSSTSCRTFYQTNREYTNTTSGWETVAVRLSIYSGYGASAGDYSVWMDVDDLTSMTELGNGNDSDSTADFVTQPDVAGEDTMTVEGGLTSSDYIDYFGVMLRPGQELEVTLETDGDPGDLWAVIAYDYSDGSFETWDLDYGDQTLTFELSNSGDDDRERYDLAVYSTDNSATTDYTLTLEWDPVASGRT